MESQPAPNSAASILAALRAAVERHRAGDAQGALPHYEATVAADPSHFPGWLGLGLARQQTGNTTGALEAFERAVQLNSSNAEAQSYLGGVLLLQGRLPEAIAALRTAIGLNPRMTDAQFNLGVALEQTGDVGAAEAAWRTTLQIDPAHLKSCNNLAVLLDRTKRGPEALAVLQTTLMHAQPGMADIPRLLQNLGQLIDRVGMRSRPLEMCERAVMLSPRNAGWQRRLGTVLKSCGEYKRAAECYRIALALGPDYKANVLSHMGDISAACLDFAAAEKNYREALAAEPSHAGAMDGLELVKQRINLQAGPGLQGVHGPGRQIFMSATVDLARNLNPRPRILEVGTYLGASAITWSRALDRLCDGGSLMCVDSWGDADGAHYEGGMEESLRTGSAYQAFLSNVKALPRSVAVEHIRGRSSDAFRSLPAASYDIVYIDGSHMYAEVLADLRDSDRVLKEGGFVCGDDLELQSGDCDMDFARANIAQDFVVDPRARRPFHPGVTLAVAEIYGRVSAYDGFWIMQKHEGGYRPVEMKDATGVLPLHWPAAAIDLLRKRFSAGRELRAVVEPRL
jgi:tetratricopeptide (TPR) repeat protein